MRRVQPERALEDLARANLAEAVADDSGIMCAYSLSTDALVGRTGVLLRRLEGQDEY
jgi:hypothetical protein